MPIAPVIAGALISGGLGLTGSIFNNIMGNRAYKRDRADALADWNRQNEYNSPKAQMQRFKEAGLNPQLIYGQGTPGNATATPVQQQKSGAPSYKADLQEIYGEAMRLSQNMQQTQQTVENLKTNQELMQANIELQNQLKDQREKEFPFKLDKIDASIYALNSSSDWKNKLLNPTLDSLTTKTYLSKTKDAREERWLSSQLLMNNSRRQQVHAQTALTMQQRAMAIEKTVNQKVTNEYQRVMLSEALRKLQMETENIIQNRKTSMSVEQLNRINAELREWENTYKPINESTKILQQILSPFTRSINR